MYFFLWILPVWFSHDIMTDHVITVGNTVTLTLPPPPWSAPGPGVGADIGCVSSGLGVSVWPQSGAGLCTQIRGRLREPDPGLPWVGISSALASGHTYHITFPLIRMSGPWNIFSERGYCMLSYFDFCCFEYIFAVPSNNANDQSYW